MPADYWTRGSGSTIDALVARLAKAEVASPVRPRAASDTLNDTSSDPSFVARVELNHVIKMLTSDKASPSGPGVKNKHVWLRLNAASTRILGPVIPLETLIVRGGAAPALAGPKLDLKTASTKHREAWQQQAGIELVEIADEAALMRMQEMTLLANGSSKISNSGSSAGCRIALAPSGMLPGHLLRRQMDGFGDKASARPFIAFRALAGTTSLATSTTRAGALGNATTHSIDSTSHGLLEDVLSHKKKRLERRFHRFLESRPTNSILGPAGTGGASDPSLPWQLLAHPVIRGVPHGTRLDVSDAIGMEWRPGSPIPARIRPLTGMGRNVAAALQRQVLPGAPASSQPMSPQASIHDDALSRGDDNRPGALGGIPISLLTSDGEAPKPLHRELMRRARHIRQLGGLLPNMVQQDVAIEKVQGLA